MGNVRKVTDAQGIVWEIFREDDDALAAVLEWGHRPVAGTPGLIFTSTAGMRRITPAPDDWTTLSDELLVQLLVIAVELY